MPPPLPLESESESIADEAPAAQSEPESLEEELGDAKVNDNKEDEEEDEDEDEDEDGEIYIVEAIQDHRSDFEDGEMRYHVKWKGYEKKSDRTWETEENLEGAREILEAYWQEIKGKPAHEKGKSSKKRGRQSAGSRGPDTTKRPRMTRTKRRSNGAMEQDIDPSPMVGFTDVGDDDWKVPPAKDGSWDPLVQSVDTVVRESADGELWGYMIWNEKNDDGRFYRSKAKLPVIYKACPQRMLHFYEKHLVFSNTTDADPTDDASAA